MVVIMNHSVTDYLRIVISIYLGIRGVNLFFLILFKILVHIIYKALRTNVLHTDIFDYSTIYF